MSFHKLLTSPGAVLLQALAVGLLAFAWFSGYCDNSLFESDAADYLSATRGGFLASWLDTDSVGLPGVIRLARENPKERSHLWDYLMRQRDSAAYRHFHVTGGFYPAALTPSGSDERGRRLVYAAQGALICSVALAGLILAGVNPALAALAAALCWLTPSLVMAVTDVSPHALFLAIMLVGGFALARYVENGFERRAGIVAGVATGLGIATLELSIVMLAAFGLFLLMQLRRVSLRELLRSLGLPLLAAGAALVVAWPVGVIKGNYLLSYAVFIFQALFRRQSYFQAVPLQTVLMRAVQNTPVTGVAVVLLAGVVAWLLIRGRGNRQLEIFACLTLGFLAQGTLNRFSYQTYVSHFAVLAWVTMALAAQLLIREKKGLPVALAAALFALAFAGIPQWLPQPQERVDKRARFTARVQPVLALLRAKAAPGAVLVADSHFEMWGYYLPEYQLRRLWSSDDETTGTGPTWIVSDTESATEIKALDGAAKIGGFLVGCMADCESR